MRAVDVIIGVGWVVFWIGWLVAAGGTKAGRSGSARFAGVRIAVLIIVLLLFRTRALGHPDVTRSLWLECVGLAMFLVGLGLAVWARVYLGRNWGMPMSQKADPELVTSGPYRRIRHPIYSGIVLAMIGTTLAVSILWLVAVAVAGAYFVYSAYTEERFMLDRFPDTYPQYKRSTKMLIPYVF